jgi:hypothetical protein
MYDIYAANYSSNRLFTDLDNNAIAITSKTIKNHSTILIVPRDFFFIALENGQSVEGSTPFTSTRSTGIRDCRASSTTSSGPSSDCAGAIGRHVSYWIQE